MPVMIDTVGAAFPLGYAPGIDQGEVVFLSAKKGEEGRAIRWREVRGAYGGTMEARVRGRTLEVRGSPGKFLRGHNLFGPGAVLAVVPTAALQIAAKMGVEVAWDTMESRRTAPRWLALSGSL